MGWLFVTGLCIKVSANLTLIGLLATGVELEQEPVWEITREEFGVGVEFVFDASLGVHLFVG